MPESVTFWFDFSCPYAYLGSTQIERVERESGKPVVLEPFLLGGVFRALKQPQNMSTTLSEPKKRHNRLDLLRWAHWLGVPLNTPSRHPNRTVEALRCFLASPANRRRDLMRSLYQAYWVEGLDVSSPVVLQARMKDLGLDAREVWDLAQTARIKAQLFEQTARAVATGVFGAPAWVVGDALFWGQDRVEMVIRAARDGWTVPDSYGNFAFNQDD